MASNVSQISVVSAEVAKDIADVSFSSQELTNSSNLVKQGAAGLNELTGKMQSVAGRFKV